MIRFMRRDFIGAVLIWSAASLSAAETTVILVRHAEKVSEEMAGDPPLSEAGAARAKELVRTLAGTKIDAIYTTPFRRTRDTVAPLASARELTPIEIKSGKTYAADLVSAIKANHSGKSVLVVGHSNTTPDVIRALGIAAAPAIPDWQYDDLFFVTLNGTPKLVARTYGTGPVEIREWAVPWPDTRPRDPTVDAAGKIWFVGQTGDYIGRFDPATAKFERFELEKGTGPHNVIAGPDGALWFAGNRAGYVGRLDPDSGNVRKFASPGDPHTLVNAPDGSIWFTAQVASYVGRLDPKSGEIRTVKVPAPGSRPYGIVVERSGRLWLNEFGRNAIGSIDPKTMALAEYDLPERTRGRRIAVGSDGGIWYVDYGRGLITRFDPATKKVQEWPTPAGSGSLPYAMAADDRGRMWFVETGPQPNRLVGFDPATKTFFATAKIPSGGGTVRHMVFDAKRREIWFGTDANTIGRARIP
jgi:virginiamycin B lyase